MKSVEMTSETYAGIAADALAFTPSDEAVWFESKDIQCLPAIIATLKGLRAKVAATKLTLSQSAVNIVAGESALVSSEYTPMEAFLPVSWSSNNAAVIVTSKDDGINAVIKGVKPGKAVVTASGGSQTATVNVTVV